MVYRRTISMLAAGLLALAITACDEGATTEAGTAEDANGEAEATDTAGDEDASSEQADAGGDSGGQPDDLPDEWPDELPVHSDAEVGRTEVIEREDGTVRVELQYSMSESTDEALAYLESLADHGWDVQADEGSEGTSSFVDGTLEGHGWQVSVSFQNNRYTWAANQQG